MSLFDQFNEEDSYGAGIGYGGGYDDEEEEVLTSGFVSARMEEEEPVFQKRRLQLGQTTSSIVSVVSASGTLVIAFANNHVIRHNVRTGDSQAINMGRRDRDRIVRMFLDPTASHLIMCLKVEDGFETLYVHASMDKPSSLKKLRGSNVTAVGWNPLAGASSATTLEILVGTSQGVVYEVEIVNKKEKQFNQIYKLETGRNETLTGIRLQEFPSKKSRAYFIMLTTPCHSFQFIGSCAPEPPFFQPILANRQNMRFHELPGDISHSNTEFWAEQGDAPEAFGWLTAPGVYYGELDFARPQRTAQDGQNVVTVMQSPRLIQYTFTDEDVGGPKPIPVAIGLTKFHLILLYPDHYEALCLLNDKVALTENFITSRIGRMRGLATDESDGQMYAYSDKFIFNIERQNETRDVWQLYLEKGQYDAALEYCTDNPAHRDRVLTAQGEQFFKEGDYQSAAEVFARTEASFEEVTLRFMAVEQSDALRTYLRRKLESLGGRDKMQLTMLCTWLVEIYLNSLNSLKDSGDQQSYILLQSEFRAFLETDRTRRSLDKATAYDLIASHGNVDDLVFFASLVEDYERVISHFIQSEEYRKALDTLSQQKRLDLYYRFAPALMEHSPRDLITACMRRPALDPRQLIPAFVRYQQSEGTNSSESLDQAIRYLEWCVSPQMGNQDTAIHNYLISLYAKLPGDERLLTFLESQGAEPVYDLKYALRLCTQEGKVRACVAIYSTMGLFSEAVELALTVDLKLARQNADMPEFNQELKKKLWLRIARHVVEHEKNIKAAMAVLQECDLLKIEDILPFFPDFVTIDNFQADITKSLGEYNNEIVKLKQKMRYATQSANSIRNDIQELKNKYSVVDGEQLCGLCGYPLLSRAFFLFPCQHGFHCDCLTEEVMKRLPLAQQRRVEHLHRQLRNQSALEESGQTPAQIRAEVDEIIAEDCVLCGEYMIRSIDDPFVPHEDLDDFVRSWSFDI